MLVFNGEPAIVVEDDLELEIVQVHHLQGFLED
jgi:hypothetical protein